MSRTTAYSITSVPKTSAAEQDDNEDSKEIEKKHKAFAKIYDQDHIITSKKLRLELGSAYVDGNHKTYKKSLVAFRKEDIAKAAKKEKSVKNKSVYGTKQPKKQAKVRSVKRRFLDSDYGKGQRDRTSSILHGLTVLGTFTKQKHKKYIAAKKTAENAATSTIKERLSPIPRNSMHIPNVDSSKRFSAFSVRNKEDFECKFDEDEDYTTDAGLAFAAPKYKPNYDFLVPSRGPSYSGYELPLHVKSKIRYSESCKRYEKQFKNEIHNLIEFQPTAIDGAFFARQMAYTTLWPPLHTKKEVDRTSKMLHPLTGKEQRRLKFLMVNDIPRWTS